MGLYHKIFTVDKGLSVIIFNIKYYSLKLRTLKPFMRQVYTSLCCPCHKIRIRYNGRVRYINTENTNMIFITMNKFRQGNRIVKI